LIAEVLGQLYTIYGADELARFRRSIDMFLKRTPASYTDNRQQPKFFFFPDLPTAPFFDKRLLQPWCENIESCASEIKSELEFVLDNRPLEPFLTLSSDAEHTDYVSGSKGNSAWEALFFYRNGQRYADNAALCPLTSNILDTVPLARVDGNAPEVLFSILAPDSRIVPHRGSTNTRAVVHLPLIIPADCGLKVGGETIEWTFGECFAFDDTFEHEAWNRSSLPRAVLIFDIWNPHLSEIERHSISNLIPLLTKVEAALRF